VISEPDAIYHMVSSVFGYEMKHIACPSCGYSHLDKDWFSIHPHRGHLCAGCGKKFRDTDTAIGNPICRIRETWGTMSRRPKPARKRLVIRQADYPGGLQVWGSNPAIIWTGPQREEEGIHIHAFCRDDGKAMLDDTFSQVTIDGVRLDPRMVRTLMAQNALPHIEHRIVAMSCPSCGEPKFSVGEQAFAPAAEHHCTRCGGQFRGSGRLRKTIGNPLIGILERIATSAPRRPQRHSMGLLPETP
jgi:transposase-like protein